MQLADLRRFTVKKRLRIRFAIANGMECVVNEHGVAQVPALREVPSFNLEQELAGAQQFFVETAAPEKEKTKAAPRSYSREEMLKLTDGAGAGDAGHDEHDE